MSGFQVSGWVQEFTIVRHSYRIGNAFGDALLPRSLARERLSSHNIEASFDIPSIVRQHAI